MKDTDNERKYYLFNYFDNIFSEQLGLELSDILTIVNYKFKLKGQPLMAISMASMSLDLTKDEHRLMAEFIELIQNDGRF